MQKKPSTKAQGALEYLLIIGAAILIVAIVILAVSGAIGGGKGSVSDANKELQNTYDDLRGIAANPRTLAFGTQMIVFSTAGQPVNVVFAGATANTTVSWNNPTTTATYNSTTKTWTNGTATVPTNKTITVTTTQAIPIPYAYNFSTAQKVCRADPAKPYQPGFSCDEDGHYDRETCEQMPWCQYDFVCENTNPLSCNNLGLHYEPVNPTSICGNLGCGVTSGLCSGTTNINCTTLNENECNVMDYLSPLDNDYLFAPCSSSGSECVPKSGNTNSMGCEGFATQTSCPTDPYSGGCIWDYP